MNLAQMLDFMTQHRKGHQQKKHQVQRHSQLWQELTSQTIKKGNISWINVTYLSRM